MQHAAGHAPDSRRVERVLAAVTGNAELWQTEHRDISLFGSLDRGDDAITIAVPVKRSLVEYACAKFDKFHFVSPVCSVMGDADDCQSIIVGWKCFADHTSWFSLLPGFHRRTS